MYGNDRDRLTVMTVLRKWPSHGNDRTTVMTGWFCSNNLILTERLYKGDDH